MDQKPLQKYLQQYEETIGKIAGLYYWFSVRGTGNYDLDRSDLEQAGRIAVFKVSERKPEMLDIFPYVRQAIKYAVIGEMRKMKHKVKQIYLVREHEEMIQAVDVLPTEDKSNEKLSELEELLYRIKHDFSPEDAKALEALLERCDNIYDLNLSEPPSTDTKDRVRIVTRMDLTDEEMVVYAEVLLGARERFPKGYLSTKGKKLGWKYLSGLLNSIGMTAREFAKENKTKLLQKYKLLSIYTNIFNYDLSELIKGIDVEINLVDISKVHRWVSLDIGTELVNWLESFIKELDRAPNKDDFRSRGYGSMLGYIFNGNPHLSVEFVCPGTYPRLSKRAGELRSKYDISESDLEETQELRKIVSRKREIMGIANFSQEEIRKIKDAQGKYNNVFEVARKFNCSPQSIYKYWTKRRIHNKITNEKRQLMERLFKERTPIPEIAKSVGISPSTTWAYFKAKKMGLVSTTEYHKYLMKQRGHESYSEYLKHLSEQKRND